MLFAIGDIHGYFDHLRELMAHCRNLADAAEEPARFVLLGDYIDRGPASNEVLEFLSSRPADVQAIRGNHEELMLMALEDPNMNRTWHANGGLETLVSYWAYTVNGIPADHIELVRGLPFFIDDGLRLFVHAGIDPADPDGRDPHILMWTRNHPGDDAVLPRFVVHGHTPTHDGKPDLRPNRLNLDTGAGFGEVLTAAAFQDDIAEPLAFIDHTGEMTAL
jgi:serine/threonine protein phosphatase 1